jgi:hypothetical protein
MRKTFFLHTDMQNFIRTYISVWCEDMKEGATQEELG